MATIRRILARTHPDRRQGYAQIDVQGDGLPVEGVTLTFARTGTANREFLSVQSRRNEGTDPGEGERYAWQADEGAALPMAVEPYSGGIYVTLGRNALALLDQQSIYGITVRGPGGPLGPERAVAWREVAPVPAGQAVAAEEPVAPPPPPPVAPKPEEKPAETVEKPKDVLTADPDRKPETLPPRPDPTGRYVLAGVIVTLAVAVVAGMLYAGYVLLAPYLLGKGHGDANPPITGEPVPTPPPSGNPLEALAAGPAEAALAEAQKRREKGDIPNAQFLLRAAGEKGSAEALRQLGQTYDPTNLTPGRTTQAPTADVGKAYTYYRQAEGKGSAEAKADLARLRATVEKQAADGDETAITLLQRWSQP
jgi:hypothetical protein